MSPVPQFSFIAFKNGTDQLIFGHSIVHFLMATKPFRRRRSANLIAPRRRSPYAQSHTLRSTNQLRAFSAENPTAQQSGVSIDAEFNAVKLSLDETQQNLALDTLNAKRPASVDA